jgi:hypothetical protein
MEEISLADALKITNKWVLHSQPISVLCFSPTVVLSSKNCRVGMCLDECLELLVGEQSSIRIFTTEAIFSMVLPEDLPDLLFEFEKGIRIDFRDKEMQWYVLA